MTSELARNWPLPNPALRIRNSRAVRPWQHVLEPVGGYLMLAERLGSLLGQMGEARTQAIGVRYYGELANTTNEILGSAVLVGLFRPMLSTSITPVNARAIAAARGVELLRPARAVKEVGEIESGDHSHSAEFLSESSCVKNWKVEAMAVPNR